jgi:hypothetical protein
VGNGVLQRGLCDSDMTQKYILGEVYSVLSVPRCYAQDKSRVQSVVRQSPANKDVNTEAEEPTILEAVTRRQPVKIQQTEELIRAVVNCRACELAITL